MKIEAPILVESHSEGDEERSLYWVRPLFLLKPSFSSRFLSAALTKLAGRLKQDLDKLGADCELAEIAKYSFFPEVQIHRVDLRLELRRQEFRGPFPLVTFRHFSRQLAFSPFLPDVWFDICRGQTLRNRAQEVFTRYFRNLAKEEGEDAVDRQLMPFSGKGRGRLSVASVEIEVTTRRDRQEGREPPLAELMGGKPADGAVELRRVGRCLDELYPDQLQRAFGREVMARELEKLLSAPDCRPVLLLGPSMVGKTALIHEVLVRRIEKRLAAQHAAVRARNNLWLLSPQRLVSGMSYVGQWENRLLAILKTARRNNHVLYFDDWLGMYRAGITSQSNLSAADVLRPVIERREVRVLVEMAPEQFRVFRERDRGLADQFHLLRLAEPSEDEVFRVLLDVVRHLEIRHGVRFSVDVLPTVLEFNRRYERSLAHPGKAIRWLQRLALKSASGAWPVRALLDASAPEISREVTLEEFRAATGLDTMFLDRRTKLDRKEVLGDLEQRVVGQRAALETMADVVSVAKARLNAPGRPLGTLLFLGPTGVGKTESAKALAQYLFGNLARSRAKPQVTELDRLLGVEAPVECGKTEGRKAPDSNPSDEAARLLRFDMNEFPSPDAAARLVGTFEQPEGLLTSAIRRQPFSVVLFDEIEKAHPRVFDLLLQVLGEARLTDALGRTADFSNAVIILTSNLGTREAAQEIGFGETSGQSEAVYLRAVREFFRPEFFNRLDRIVPFSRLGMEEMERIAARVVDDLLVREGLMRRKCAVEVAEEALAWVIEQGYHPQLGARAMKRAVETHVVNPLARRLADIHPETPTVLSVTRREDGLKLRVTPLEEAARFPESARPAIGENIQAWLDRAHAALDRIEAQCRRHRPESPLGTGVVSPDYAWYLGMAEYLKETRKCALALVEKKDTDSRPDATSLQAPQPPTRKTRGGAWFRHHRRLSPERQILKEIFAAQDIQDYLRDLASAAETEVEYPGSATGVDELFDRLALAEMLAPTEDGWSRERALVLIRSIGDFPFCRTHTARSICRSVNFGADWESRWQEYAVEFGLQAVWFPRWPVERRNTDYFDSISTTWPEQIPDEAARERYRSRFFIDVVIIEGHRAGQFARLHEGTHLFALGDGRLQPVQVVVSPLAEGRSFGDLLGAILEQHLRREERDRGGPLDPFQWRPVVGLYSESGSLITDFRTGRLANHWPWNVGAALPLPAELPK